MVEAGAEDQSLPSANTYSSPVPTKRAKKRHYDPTHTMMENAFDMMKTATATLTKPCQEPDEITAFFNYVSTKVKNYPSETRKGVQHAVFEVLMKADQGFYEWPANASFRPARNEQNNFPTEELPHTPVVSPSTSNETEYTHLTPVQLESQQMSQSVNSPSLLQSEQSVTSGGFAGYI